MSATIEWICSGGTCYKINIANNISVMNPLKNPAKKHLRLMKSVILHMLVVCLVEKVKSVVAVVVDVEVIMVLDIVADCLSVAVVVVAVEPASLAVPMLVMVVVDIQLMMVVVDIADPFVAAHMAMACDATHVVVLAEMVGTLAHFQQTNVPANPLHPFPIHISGDYLFYPTILALRRRCCPNCCPP